MLGQDAVAQRTGDGLRLPSSESKRRVKQIIYFSNLADIKRDRLVHNDLPKAHLASSFKKGIRTLSLPLSLFKRGGSGLESQRAYPS